MTGKKRSTLSMRPAPNSRMQGKSKTDAKGPVPFPWDSHPIAYPKELPISKRREDIIAAIRKHPVIILSGETGSGKTTQLPKMCLDAGRGRKRRIACTQPRRVAALSIAKRVSEELGVEYGQEVGSKIRFADQTSKRTRIKFMTDGMLLSEIQSDPSMREYDTVIIDEAHERSLNIDFLLGHLNQLRLKRPDLKIIVTSATIDIEKFSQAFDDAPVIEVSGRVYPVDIIYAPLDELLEDSGDFTIIDGVAESVDRILDEFGQGDILAFLPTEKDIRETMDLLEGRLGNQIAILPCFGRLSNADQQRIFSRSPKRKIVLATNIAETSLTIPGIRFVIDTGLARISRYNPRGRTKRLPIEDISQSSANQRKGRCGRVQDGICIRLYSEKNFEKRVIFAIPEIQRANLAEVILRMMASRLGDIETFPFIDPPTPVAIKSGYALLEELGAIDPQRRLTPIGRKLARLPIDPTAGRMLLQAKNEGVVDQLLVIASALSIQDPRERPLGKEELARAAHKRFVHRESDFLTLLNIWEGVYDQTERLSQSRLRKFCKSHFLSYLRLREWMDVKKQLTQSLADFERSQKIKHEPPRYKTPEEKFDLRKYGGVEYRSIHHCLAAGLLANPARKEEPNLYRATGDRKTLIFPGSGLFNRKAQHAKTKRQKQELATKTPSPGWILAGEIVETNRLYARTVAVIDPTWLLQIGSHILKYSHSQPSFEVDQGRVTCLESIRIHGLELQRKNVSYLKVDPVKATEIFIREALLNEDFEANYEFLDANRKLKNRMQNAQTIAKMQSWIGIEESAYRFYCKRLKGIASLGDLNQWLKEKAGRAGEPLFMSETDLTPVSDEPIDLAAFPETARLENAALPIVYQYKPGEANDGVTLKVPYAKAKALDGPMLDWLVPGHLETKILHLIKALPKDHRRPLQPLAETATEISRKLRPTHNSLCQSLAEYLKNHYAIETYASDWNEEAIPTHLQVRIDVHDSKGQTIIEGRSAKSVQDALREHESKAPQGNQGQVEAIWKKARQQWNRPIDGLDQLEPQSEKIQIGEHNGVPIFGYPALCFFGDQLKLSIFKTPTEAQVANKSGIGALIEYELRRELAWIQEDLRDFSKLGPVAIAFAPLDDLKQQGFVHMKGLLRTHGINTIDTKEITRIVGKAKTDARGLTYKLIDLIKATLDARQSLKIKTNLPTDLQAEVDRLVPADFIVRTPHWALKRIPTYLRGIELRSRNRQTDPQRDQRRQEEIDALKSRLKSLFAPQETIEEISWTIEEYALSLFAQKLGTAFPVSAKRISEKFTKAGAAPAAFPKNLKAQPAKAVPKTTGDKPTQSDLQKLQSFFNK
ncbi:MAG: ATP-dependent RNA helicase HrpA [Opitutales bacterium]|nr:ATP-dependent RNA helicase HrpA [Opitutales bacterium]